MAIEARMASNSEPRVSHTSRSRSRSVATAVKASGSSSICTSPISSRSVPMSFSPLIRPPPVKVQSSSRSTSSLASERDPVAVDVELAHGVDAADQRAHRAAGDRHDLETGRFELLDRADVRQALGAAGTQRQGDGGPAHALRRFGSGCSSPSGGVGDGHDRFRGGVRQAHTLRTRRRIAYDARKASDAASGMARFRSAVA